MGMEFQVDSVVQWTGFTLVINNFFLSIYNHSINLYIYIFINLYIYKFIYLYIYIYVLCMKCWSQLIYWIFNHWINLQFYIEFHRCSIWYTNSCYVIHQHSWHRAFVRDQLISLVKQGFTVLVLGWVTAQLKCWIREEYFVYKIEMPPDWGRSSRTENGRHPKPYLLLVHASTDDLQSFSLA